MKTNEVLLNSQSCSSLYRGRWRGFRAEGGEWRWEGGAQCFSLRHADASDVTSAAVNEISAHTHTDMHS